MNKTKYFYFFFILLFLKNDVVFSQQNDAGLWASVNFEKKISRKATINFTEELRFKENVSQLGMALSEIGGDYKINKTFSAGLNYRFAQKKQLDGFYSFRHRFGIDCTFKHKIKKIGFSIAEKYQLYYADINSSETGKIPDRYLRTKLALKYDLKKKIIAYVSAELFYFINDPTGGEIDNWRYIAGVQYQFNKKASIDLSYLIDNQIHVDDPLTSFVTCIGFNYSF